jgi:hypothetical protein
MGRSSNTGGPFPQDALLAEAEAFSAQLCAKTFRTNLYASAAPLISLKFSAAAGARGSMMSVMTMRAIGQFQGLATHRTRHPNIGMALCA